MNKRNNTNGELMLAYENDFNILLVHFYEFYSQHLCFIVLTVS